MGLFEKKEKATATDKTVKTMATATDTAKAIQAKIGADADGVWGAGTTKAMQKFLGVDQDGVKGPNTIKAWQTWCNHNL